MTGREIADTLFVPHKEGKNETLLKVDNLSLKGGFSNVSFELKRGDILGVTGLLGSGRTELALSLIGVYPATSGAIAVRGKKVKIKSIRQATKLGIYMFLKIGLPRDFLCGDLSIIILSFRS